METYSNKESRIALLETLIPDYAQSYYDGESKVSDEYFDSLVDELRELSPESHVLSDVGWGSRVSGNKKKSHLYNLFVGSLGKVKSVESIPERFINQKTRISAKLDGLSVVSYYSHGERFLSLTRGNGYEGKDVTSKINRISPHTKRLKVDFTGAIRGEVVISNFTWSQISGRYSDNPSANQRNIASGILNRDTDDEDLDFLDMVVYKVIASESDLSVDGLLDMKDEVFSEFTTVPFFHCNTEWNQKVLSDAFSSFSVTYPCDGLVLTRDVSRSDNTPIINYDEVAFKFQSEIKTVEVQFVSWSATRTGKIQPRIWFDPVNLSGAVVRKATGFNAKFIEDNKIGKGSIVDVCRSGEVIPDIVRVISPSNDFSLPCICPRCGGDLRRDGVDLVCDYENEEQLFYHFIHTLGETDGAGFSLYSKILKISKVENFDDFFRFLSNLKNNFNETSSQIVSEISGSVTKKRVVEVLSKLVNNVDPTRFLVACNITGVSWTTAKSIVKEYPNFFADLLEGKSIKDSLYKVKGIGQRTVDSISCLGYRVRVLLYAIGGLDTFVKESQESNSQEVLFKVAITGSLSMKRSDFDKILSSRGICQSSNFKEIKYLITNNPLSTSSKMKRAKELGVEIISESEFTSRFL